MVKKLTLILLGGLLAVSSVMAGTGPQKVEYTPHNFSSTADNFWFSQYKSTNEDEICVFCHTPHGGSLDGPLWNRDLTPNTGYTHYTSDTLSSAVGASNRAVNSESLVCLACHDGSIGIGDNLLNPGGVIPDNDTTKIQIGWNANLAISVPGPQIGASLSNLTSNTDLSDDHPISFSYSAVLADKPGTLNSVASVETAGLVLFGAGENVECSTCHDPHVSYIVDAAFPGADAAYDPFLAIPNTGSSMCLTCHIK